MKKLQLVGWLVATGGAAWVLGSGVTWPGTPEAQAMAVVRVVAAALAAYLFVVTVLAVRLPRVAPRFVRRLVAGALGTAMLAAPLAGPVSAQDRAPAPAEAPVLRRVDPPVAFSEPPARAGGVQDAENANEVTLEVGDHLWSVAEEVVSGRLGRQPTDAEVVPYWHELLRANDGRLRSGDPNLVFPGETVHLPS